MVSIDLGRSSIWFWWSSLMTWEQRLFSFSVLSKPVHIHVLSIANNLMGN